MSFMSIGVIFHDDEVLCDTGDLVDFQFNLYIKDSVQNVTTTDVTNCLKELYEYAEDAGDYVESQQYKEAVDKFMKFVENKKGIFFNWALEADFNVMFVEGVDSEEELLEYLDQFKKED